MWHEGTIGIPVNGGGMKAAHYRVKAYKRRRRFGIDGGRISEMTVTVNGETVLRYDSGWEISPDENDETVMIAYTILMQEYN